MTNLFADIAAYGDMPGGCNPYNRLLADLRKVGPHARKWVDNLSPIAGRRVVVCGSNDDFTRADIRTMVQSHYGIASSKFTDRTELVIYGDGPGAAYLDALENNTPTMHVNQFLHEYDGYDVEYDNRFDDWALETVTNFKKSGARQM